MNLHGARDLVLRRDLARGLAGSLPRADAVHLPQVVARGPGGSRGDVEAAGAGLGGERPSHVTGQLLHRHRADLAGTARGGQGGGVLDKGQQGTIKDSKHNKGQCDTT